MSLVLDLIRRDRSSLKKVLPADITEGHLESLLGVACLAHDLGNPPFGHAGESSIQRWFVDYFDLHKDLLDLDYQYDFRLWEGNAQTQRIVLKLQRMLDDNGLNLTCASLATLQKYVASAKEVSTGRREGQSRKKPGYFLAEKERLQRVWEETGLADDTGSRRHPLGYLMEAADDIAYAAIDIEDALKKKIVSFDMVRDELAVMADQEFQRLLTELDTTHANLRADRTPRADVTAWMTFRVAIISEMFQRAADFYNGHFAEFESGDLDVSVVKASSAAPLLDALRNVAVKYVYDSYPICALETTGDRVIRGLLEAFVPAILKGPTDKRSQNGKMYSLLPDHARYWFQKGTMSTYEALLVATDFISGMTDSYALQLYRQLHGIELGELGH